MKFKNRLSKSSLEALILKVKDVDLQGFYFVETKNKRFLNFKREFLRGSGV